MIGKTILHYKILEKLGEGGMGIVYKAQDTKLKRDVAIKFLPRQIAASEEERQRFKIEAQAAAALNHPNIATIHAIEEHDDQMFIVMEYIEGRELRDIVHTNLAKVLNLRKVVDYASQIASGLQAAHEKDVTHRDIKSANIMVTDKGQIKIMDFGLAKVRGGAQVTKLGTTLGTAANMSPEQAQGLETDHRTDIWAFGVVLYEMLTGKLPFGGDYEQAVIYGIMNEEPDYPDTIPQPWHAILKKSLAKTIDERYQSTEDLLSDLRNISTEKTVPTKSGNRRKKYSVMAVIGFALITMISLFVYIKSDRPQSDLEIGKAQISRLAVLPFANFREDPETDFLGLALADEVIGDLTYIKNILVRPSSAVRQYHKQAVDAPTAGAVLKVDYVLTGNYVKEAELIRLNFELVDVNSNEMLWRDNVETKYENAFQLQDIVAERILEGLKVQFSPEERQRMKSDISENPLAYEYYLRALSYPYSNEGHQLAVSMLNKSIELDSTFAPSWDELGFRKQQISYFVVGESQQIYEAERAFVKASALNPDLLSALAQLIAIYTELGKAEQAAATARRALALNPNSADNHFFLGYVYRFTGFLEEAEKEMQTAVKFDPGNAKFRSIGVTQIYLGKHRQALGGFDLDRGSPYALGWQGQAYLRLGENDRALSLLNRVIEMEPEGILGFWATGMKAYLIGEPQTGLPYLQKMEENTKDPEQFYNSANLYGLLGYREDCIRALRKAVSAGFFCYPLFASDPFLDSVRGEPGFQQVLVEAKAKHEAFGKKFFSNNVLNHDR